MQPLHQKLPFLSLSLYIYIYFFFAQQKSSSIIYNSVLEVLRRTANDYNGKTMPNPTTLEQNTQQLKKKDNNNP